MAQLLPTRIKMGKYVLLDQKSVLACTVSYLRRSLTNRGKYL